MAEKILMLALSPTMETGTIITWLKKTGDTISSGDVICEVETDKATMDYESIQEGVLRAITAEEGSSVGVGDVIGIIGDADEDISALLEEARHPREQEQAGEDAPGGGGSEPAPEQGKPGEDTSATGGAGPRPEPEAATKDDPPPAGAPGDRVIASPLAKKLARQRGLSLESLRGSGPGGRIVKRDVEKAPDPGGTAPAAWNDDGIEKRQPAAGKRKVIADRLAASMREAPHYYEKVRAGMDGLLAARKRLNQNRDRKLMLNSFLIKFAAEALKNHPAVRSSWQDGDIVTYGRIDIGLAVALDDGLITPVVRDCGSKSITDIDAELAVLIEKAQNGKLQPEEYSGSIFTISNLGAWGIEEFTAVINPPASAILAVGAARKEPVVSAGGAVGVETLTTLTMSSDHRVIDGAAAAAFLVDLKGLIEYPVAALI